MKYTLHRVSDHFYFNYGETKQIFKRLVIVLIFGIISFIPNKRLFSQQAVAPSLQIGLNGFEFNKGMLDQELILEIISDKQEEIKDRLIRYMLLDKLNLSGATVYGYVDNTIDILKNVQDPEIRTRSIIENSVNLAITGALVEYFVLKNKNTPEMQELCDSINQELSLYVRIDRFLISSISSIEDIEFDSDVPFTKEEREEYFNYISQKKNDKANELYASVISRTGTTKKDYQNVQIRQKQTKFISYLLDMAALVISENQELKRLGISRNNYVHSYNSMNSFISFQTNSDRKRISKSLKNIMKEDLKKLIEYTGYLAYIDRLNNVNIKNFQSDKSQLVQKTFDHNSITTIVSSLGSNFNNLNNALTKGGIGLNQLNKITQGDKQINKDDFKLYSDNLTVLSDFCFDIRTLNLENLNDNRLVGDLLFRLNSQVMPALNNLLALEPSAINIQDDLVNISNLLTEKLQLDSTVLSDQFYDLPISIIFTKLYQFNDADTYQQYFTILNDVAKLFKNEAVYSVLQTITSFTNTYMKFVLDDDGKNTIQFDVEGILSAIQQKSYNKHRWAQFNLTVGMNNGTFSSPFTIDAGESLNSISYVSEKIGLKIMIWDWAYVNSFNKGETFTYHGKTLKRLVPKKEPVVDDLHLLFYGSGLLYNITNVTTNRNFENPMFGFGIGLTFFNSLDMNFTVSKPMLSTQSQKTFNNGIVMYSLGFDIQFMEYAAKLSEKRKKQKIDNKIAELY